MLFYRKEKQSLGKSQSKNEESSTKSEGVPNSQKINQKIAASEKKQSDQVEVEDRESTPLDRLASLAMNIKHKRHDEDLTEVDLFGEKSKKDTNGLFRNLTPRSLLGQAPNDQNGESPNQANSSLNNPPISLYHVTVAQQDETKVLNQNIIESHVGRSKNSVVTKPRESKVTSPIMPELHRAKLNLNKFDEAEELSIMISNKSVVGMHTIGPAGRVYRFERLRIKMEREMLMNQILGDHGFCGDLHTKSDQDTDSEGGLEEIEFGEAKLEENQTCSFENESVTLDSQLGGKNGVKGGFGAKRETTKSVVKANGSQNWKPHNEGYFQDALQETENKKSNQKKNSNVEAKKV